MKQPISALILAIASIGAHASDDDPFLAELRAEAAKLENATEIHFRADQARMEQVAPVAAAWARTRVAVEPADVMASYQRPPLKSALRERSGKDADRFAELETEVRAMVFAAYAQGASIEDLAPLIAEIAGTDSGG
ncbi:MAG: hypothetical protein KDG50_01790 [Chromatiales bacterium]|nr:hypothetical protein [Chromatiales bacterium]